MLGADPAGHFLALATEGKLLEYFPEIDALRGVQQDPAYHPEGDAFIHTMIVLRHAVAVKGQTEDPLVFMYAALYHDAWKAETTVYDKKKRPVDIHRL
jgi:tRNA nucleotidyltransferase (CCA-adding enzyme)